MAVAGYQCLVRKSGVSTAVTVEPMSIILAGATSVKFRITDAAKRVIDPNTNFHVQNGSATIAYTSMAALDYMNGELTLTAAVAAGSVGSLSFYGSYLPITTSSDTVLDSKSFKLSESTDLLGTDVFTGTSALPVRRRLAGLRDVSLDVESLASDADLISLASAQQAGAHVVTEVFFGDVTVPRFRGICLVENIDVSGTVEGLNSTNITFKIAAVRNETSGLVASSVHKAQPA